ncbi:hypothetical protein V8D89_002723 [Ganoderma adspersum]
MGDSTSTPLHLRKDQKLAPGDSSVRSIPLAQIMLPDHLLLRVSKGTVSGYRPRVVVNWPAYKFGVEAMLRAQALEGHIAARNGQGHRQTSTQATSQQWEAEEELCKAIIGFNVKDFSEVCGESSISEKSARDMWAWLSGLNKERAWAGMGSRGHEGMALQNLFSTSLGCAYDYA